MGLIVGLVFLGVFSVVALLMLAGCMGASQQAKQVHAALHSALASESMVAHEQNVNLRRNEQASGIPWLNSWLHQFELVPRLQMLLLQADLKWTAAGLMLGCGLCFVIGAYLADWHFHSLLAACGAGVLLGAVPFWWVFHKRKKRLGRFEQGLPEALDMMVSALRSGQSFIVAMGSVGRECADPVGCEFKGCVAEQNYGLELKTAMDNLINRVPVQDLRIVATAIMIQKETGGNLAEVLDKTSHVIRERFRLKRQVAVHTAQGRLTGWILTLLPVVLGIALYVVNPTLMSVMWTNPVGIKVLWIVGGMLVLGGLIINHIVNMDV
jgi:tight adherence protein B